MDDSRFTALMAPHLATALRVAAALVGPGDAEDIVQDAGLRAWRAWPDLRDEGALRAWFLRITINVCQTWRKQQHAHREHAASDAALTVLAMAGTDPGDSEHAAMLDLYHALHTLPDDLRDIVLLRYFVGLDASEIGTLLAVPPPTIRTRLRRALALLRVQLTAPVLMGEEQGIHE